MDGRQRRRLILLTVAGVSAVVAAATGMLAYGAMVSIYRNDATDYLDEALPRIVGTWRAEALIEETHGDVLQQLSADELARVFAAYRSEYGALVSYGGAAGVIDPLLGLGEDPLRGVFSASAGFAQGRATLHAQVLLGSDGWQLYGLSIAPLQPFAAPATAPSPATGAP